MKAAASTAAHPPADAVLRLRLWGYITAAHARYCRSEPPESLADAFAEDLEIHAVGEWGVCAFRNEYFYCGWPPFDRVAATRDAWRIMARKLEEIPLVRIVVSPLNYPSVRITRKIGAVPVGVDADGFVHYELTPERLRRHGQEIGTAARA